MRRYSKLCAILQEEQAVRARWSSAFHRSALPLPGRLAAADIEPMVASIARELAHALPTTRTDGTVLFGELSPGSASTRELEKVATFAGASMSALGGSGFEVAAALFALRDLAIAAQPDERESIANMFEWLSVVALDAFASAGVAATIERQRAQLEQSTPIVLITPILPALLFVGAPDRTGLDAIFSRLLLTVVRVGARIVIVDATGLADPLHSDVIASLAGFVNHRKISGGLELLAVGLDAEHIRAWARSCGQANVEFHHEELFTAAVSQALGKQGYDIRER